MGSIHAAVAEALSALSSGALPTAAAAIHAATATALQGAGARGLAGHGALPLLQVELLTLHAMQDTVTALQKLPEASEEHLLQRVQVQ